MLVFVYIDLNTTETREELYSILNIIQDKNTVCWLSIYGVHLWSCVLYVFWFPWENLW